MTAVFFASVASSARWRLWAGRGAVGIIKLRGREMDNGFWACLIIGNIWAASGTENKATTWVWYGMAIATMVIEQIAK